MLIMNCFPGYATGQVTVLKCMSLLKKTVTDLRNFRSIKFSCQQNQTYANLSIVDCYIYNKRMISNYYPTFIYLYPL